MTTPDLTTNQLGLLRSYAGGPRIWDATSLLPTVLELQNRGLITPVGPRAHRLTPAGQALLAQNESEEMLAAAASEYGRRRKAEAKVREEEHQAQKRARYEAASAEMIARCQQICPALTENDIFDVFVQVRDFYQEWG